MPAVPCSCDVRTCLLFIDKTGLSLTEIKLVAGVFTLGTHLTTLQRIFTGLLSPTFAYRLQTQTPPTNTKKDFYERKYFILFWI